MYSTAKKQANTRIAVDVILGNWTDVTAESLLRRLVSSEVFDGAIFVLDEAMPGSWPGDPASRSALRLPTGALMIQGGEGCLCCGFRSSLGDTLRQVFLDALAKRRPIPSRVVIIAEMQDVEIFRQTLRHAPFLSQRYALRYVWRISSSFKDLPVAG